VISKDVFDVSLNLGASEQVKIVQSGSQTAGETKASAVTLHLILRKLDPSREPKVEVIKDGA
jgi:murein tripeptide amidase MpaA